MARCKELGRSPRCLPVVNSNVTDNESAKMATGKGVIQGYAAQASVDAGPVQTAGCVRSNPEVSIGSTSAPDSAQLDSALAGRLSSQPR
jgi:hypothetical protein